MTMHGRYKPKPRPRWRYRLKRDESVDGRRVYPLYLTSSCPSGKRAYDDKREAKRDARERLLHGLTRGRLYRCPICGYWHLTTQEPQPGRRIAREEALA